MPTFKCPVCGRNHFIQEHGDQEPYCTDNETSEIKKIQNLKNDENLQRRGWQNDKHNTKKDVYDNAQVVGVNKKYTSFSGSDDNW